MSIASACSSISLSPIIVAESLLPAGDYSFDFFLPLLLLGFLTLDGVVAMLALPLDDTNKAPPSVKLPIEAGISIFIVPSCSIIEHVYVINF